MNKNKPERAAIDSLRHYAMICIEQGFTLPQITLMITNDMERITPLANRVYSGVCKDKWVEISIIPWKTKKLKGDKDDVAMGKF